MGVYIKGMEMPTDHPLWIVVHSDGTVEANEVSPSRPVGWQTLRNAAVPVPPHGRLIDADVMQKEWFNLNFDRKITDGTLAYWNFQLSKIPTIIETEEGE